MPRQATAHLSNIILEFRSAMLERHLSASTINVKLAAVRKLIEEARRAGVVGGEEAMQMADVPNVRQSGTRLGNWLTKEQAKQLLAVPDRSTLKGKRDYAILALLGHSSIQTTERYLGSEQEIAIAVNDSLGL